MFLSRLVIDVGDNPDRPRPGRLWLRNLYHVHQRLCMAFPSGSRLADDPDFLKPFNPEDFYTNQVHVARQEDSGFLFRIDPLPGGRAMILAQSAVKPNWDYAFHNASFFAAYEVKAYDPSFIAGQTLSFRLLTNPTRRLSERSLGADGSPIKEWKNKNGKGKRFPVPDDRLFDWLANWHKDRGGWGASVKEDRITIQPGYLYWKKPQHSQGQRLRSVRYDGILQVTDQDRIRETVIHGIGPGKAYGLGLLSLAPV